MIKYTRLNIDYPECPFIWHYDDMANLYPVAHFSKSDYQKMSVIAECCDNNTFKNVIKEFENDTDFYILGQYKQESSFYNAETKNEVYVSFHTWLYKYLVEKKTIDEQKLYVSFDIYCGIFPLIGNINHVKNYPFRNVINKKTKKISKVMVGIGINDIVRRDCIIHDSNEYIRFSPHNQCNILLDNSDNTDDFMFVSIIKNVSIDRFDDDIFDNNDTKLNRSCVTLHIFRNKYDNNPGNIVFEKMLELVKV